MKKRVGLFVILLLAVFISSNVHAEVYYTSNNGVNLTEQEYNILNDMYTLDYVENLTMSEYAMFLDLGLDLDNTTVSSIEVELPEIVPISSADAAKSNVHQTSAKKLSITASCEYGYCSMANSLTWLKSPSVRSYDVFGSRFSSGVTYSGSRAATTYMSVNGSASGYTVHDFFSNGFGISLKLPTGTISSLAFTQAYRVEGDGVVFASYQHAAQTVTRLISKQYHIASGGYGGVFDFYSNAVGKYDQMGGVYISVSS